MDDDDHFSSDSDPDDPIIKTLPVFFTPQLARHTVLLEYPHKKPDPITSRPLLPPALRNDESAKVTARIKPGVARLELSVPLETEATDGQSHYNLDKAQSLGPGVDKQDLGVDDATSRKRSRQQMQDADRTVPLSRMTLRGDALPDQTNYCVCILKDDQLHLTPLTQTVQMRPELTYLDRLAKTRANKPDKAADGEVPANSEASEEEADGEDGDGRKRKSRTKTLAAEAKSVNVSIKSADNVAPTTGSGGGAGMYRGMATGRQDGSLFAPLRAEEAEQWTYLKYFPPDTSESNAMWEGLFANLDEELELETRTGLHMAAT